MERDQAATIFNRAKFRDYELGDLEASEWAKPGVVLICCEEPSNEPGVTKYRLMRQADAKNNAIEVAKSYLKQKWDCRTRLYARLAILQSADDRAALLEAITVLSK
jgi:hypothetical protein